MNRIYGWEPEPFYNLTDIESHPTMPTSLKQHIQVVWEKHCSNLNPDNVQCPNLRMVWMSCEGATPHDKEWLGPIMYMPIRGFPGYFYPFLGQQHYLRYIKSFSKLNLKNTQFFSPVVWIQMNNITPGVLISIQCKLWAKNIRHDPKDPMIGGVQFELLMD